MTAENGAIIGSLVMLELLLSIDNAIVLSIIALRLPEPAQRRQALTLGAGLSFVMRALALLVASWVVHLWFLSAAGAAYLIYLSASHFLAIGRTKSLAESRANMRDVVLALAISDTVFALDSVLIAVALTDNLWIIYIGVALGIIAVRCMSVAMLRLGQFPELDHAAYALVAWAGVRLGLESAQACGKLQFGVDWPVTLPEGVFWGGMVAIATVGAAFALRSRIVLSQSARR